MITHGHHDHYAGAYDVIQLLIQEGLCSDRPQVYKNVNNHLQTDKNRLEEHPELENYLFNIGEGDVFSIEGNSKLSVIETPGHIDDHLCFMLEEAGEETMMFTGDHIIGADSVNYCLLIE